MWDWFVFEVGAEEGEEHVAGNPPHPPWVDACRGEHLEGGVAAEGMPEPAQAAQVEPAAQQPARVGGKLSQLVGHPGQVGGLVVADRRPLAEPLLVRASLGP
jgi:hypothetical protein